MMAKVQVQVRWWVPSRGAFSVLLLALVAACGGGGGGAVECAQTCDSNATCIDSGGEGVCQCNSGYSGDGLSCTPEDVCQGVSTCSAEGTSCSGDQLITCAADANGCLVESTTDCSADAQICDDTASPAACIVSCDDPGCQGLADGEGFCDGSVPVTCTADQDGCLLENPADACGLMVCDDSGSAPICVANASGDSCTASFIVQDDINLVGSDFAADFTHVESFDGDGCAATSATGTPIEAVFTFDLLQGQVISLSEHGGLDAVLGILPACDGTTACYAAEDRFNAEQFGVAYTALADETVFAYVSSFFESPSPADYDIRISVTTCGDGLTEGGEECDDNNASADDGCTACKIDLGYSCDNTSTSVCSGPTDLGTYAATQAIPNTVETGALTQDSSFFYRITFTDDVLLSGTLNAAAGEDIDIVVFDDQGNAVFSSEAAGGETWTDELLLAGTYTIQIFAFEAAPNGWTLTLSTVAGPTCGDGVVGVGEACDDNMVDNDGCTSCTIDPGFVCDNSGNPSVCTLACGNGLVDEGEECDDGNAVNTDRCADACLLNADVLDLAGNDSFATAQLLQDGQIARGSLDPAGGDEFDLYTFTLAQPAWVTAELYTTVDGSTDNYTGQGLDNTMDCNADPDLHIFDGSGDPTNDTTALVSDDADGDQFCGYAGPNTDPNVMLLPANTYFIKVNDFLNDNAIAQYALDLQVDAVLALNDSCNPDFDLCDPSSLSCDPGSSLCIADLADRANFETFSAANFDLSDTALFFTPSGDGFLVAAVAVTDYADVPGTGTIASSQLSLADDGSTEIGFGFFFPFFGVDETSVFVNDNGNLSFGTGDNSVSPTADNHFALARIAAYFTDLRSDQGGVLSVDEYADHLTVTYDGVPGNGGGSVSVQVQLFSSGRIVMTYLTLTGVDGLVGISAGDALGNAPGETDFSAQLADTPQPGDLVINEVLANPSTLHDTNCDGVFNFSQDEFMEIVNVSGVPLDLTGVTISDLTGVRHTFGPLVLDDRQAVVVYGGGTPSCPGVLGIPSSSGILGLNNGGDALVLANAASATLDAMIYDSSVIGVSLTREPDLAGGFVNHDQAAGAIDTYSPGFRVSGLPF